MFDVLGKALPPGYNALEPGPQPNIDGIVPWRQGFRASPQAALWWPYTLYWMKYNFYLATKINYYV
jgi:hypothetical protein